MSFQFVQQSIESPSTATAGALTKPCSEIWPVEQLGIVPGYNAPSSLLFNILKYLCLITSRSEEAPFIGQSPQATQLNLFFLFCNNGLLVPC